MSPAERRATALAAAAALGALGLAWAAVSWWGGGDPRGRTGAAAPFVLPVIAGEGAAEGDRLALEALRGRVVVLDFWATWCVPCATLTPRLEALADRLGPAGVTLVGVNGEPGLPAARVRQAHARFGGRSASVQATAELLEAYGIGGFPTVVVLDRGGAVAARFDGLPPPGALEAAVEALAGQPEG